MKLAARFPDGATLRDHLLAANARDPLLTIQCPRECRALWSAYLDIANGRAGAESIPMSEIAAWQSLRDTQLSAWELDTLLAMDRAVVAAAAQHKVQHGNRRPT
jgi:hypothetical protein